MKEYIIKQLRECSTVRGKQRTWVSELSDDQIYELYLRLRKSQSAKSIAKHIREAWGLSPDSSIHSISQGILKFKKRIAHRLLNPQPETENFVATIDTENVSCMTGIEGLERIYKCQLNRIDQMMREERETGVNYPHLNRDIQALSALSKALIKAKEWEILHANDDPVKVRQREKKDRKIKAQWNTMMSRIGDDGRDRLIKTMDRVLELIPQHTKTLIVDENGEYHLEGPEEEH